MVAKQKASDQKGLTQLLVQEKLVEMPMLKSVLSDFARSGQIILTESIGVLVHAAIDTILPLKSTDYIASITDDVVYIECQFVGWEGGRFFIMITKDLLYQIIEAMLGGQNTNTQLKVQKREFTKIEGDIIKSVAQNLTSALQEAFSTLDPSANIVVKNIFHTKSNCFIMHDTVVIMARLNISISNKHTDIIDVVMPYDALLPAKSSLMRGFSNKKLSQQKIWHEHLTNILLKTIVKLTVEIDCIDATINKIKEMKIGDTLITQKDANEDLGVKVNGTIVSRCKIGKINDKLAAEITT